MKEYQYFTRDQIVDLIGEAFPGVVSVYYKKPKLRKVNEHQVLYIFDLKDPVRNSEKIFKICYEKIAKKFKVEKNDAYGSKHRIILYPSLSTSCEDSEQREKVRHQGSSSVSCGDLIIKQTVTKTHVEVEFSVPGAFRSAIRFWGRDSYKYYNKRIIKNNDYEKSVIW